ncbi:MAG: RND transporter, partial [Rubrivivax sp.]|nr:RND transporter [Rubrivivax sp.]
MNHPTSTPSPARRIAALVLLTATAVLGGCASFSIDGGFAPVEKTAREQLGKDLRWARSEADRSLIAERVSEMLARPLSADDAVQIALLNNRGLQAGFEELGIGEAQLVQTGRLP